jgi:hypothetical protein
MVVVDVRTAEIPLETCTVAVAVSPPITVVTVKLGKFVVMVPLAFTDALQDKATPSEFAV